MQHRGPLVSSSLVLALVACGCAASPASTTDATATASSSSTGSSSTGAPTTTDAPTTGSTGADSSSTGADPSSTGEPAAMTIYDVQQGVFPLNSVVTIKGVIVTSPIGPKGSKGLVFVEEVAGGEYSGIALELSAQVRAVLDAPPGSVVDFTGIYQESSGNSQIAIQDPADITVTGTSQIPAPAVVLSADVRTDGDKAEAYEGVLVQLEDALVTVPKADIGQFEVEGGARVSDFFLFEHGLSPAPKLGQHYASITGPLLTSDDKSMLVPRSLDDLVDELDDTTTGDTEGETTEGETTEGETTEDLPPEGIYAVQKGAYDIGAYIKLEGVVATSGPINAKNAFFVQEPAGGPFSGIYVFLKKGTIMVAPGDVLTIEGIYEEYFDFSEIVVPEAASITKTGVAVVPAPALVSAAEVGTGGAKSEDYEGVLITVHDVKVSAPVDVNNEFIVDGVLRVDDLFFAPAAWPKPQVGASYSAITGPLAYSSSNFKISPRTAFDLVK